jgi:hypothetical protein
MSLLRHAAELSRKIRAAGGRFDAITHGPTWVSATYSVPGGVQGRRVHYNSQDPIIVAGVREFLGYARPAGPAMAEAFAKAGVEISAPDPELVERAWELLVRA